jgi:hypothetical protein
MCRTTQLLPNFLLIVFNGLRNCARRPQTGYGPLRGLVLTRRHVNGVQPCNSLADPQPHQMTAQPPEPPQFTVFSPLPLSRLTIFFSFHRHLLRKHCPSAWLSCYFPGVAMASRHPSASPHHTSQTGEPVTPNAHLAPSSLSTLSSCHRLGEADVTGSRVAPVSTRRPLVFSVVPYMPPVIHSTSVTARL